MQVLSLFGNIKEEVHKSKSCIMIFATENLGTIESIIKEVENMRDENDQLRKQLFKLQNKSLEA